MVFRLLDNCNVLVEKVFGWKIEKQLKEGLPLTFSWVEAPKAARLAHKSVLTHRRLCMHYPGKVLLL